MSGIVGKLSFDPQEPLVLESSGLPGTAGTTGWQLRDTALPRPLVPGLTRYRPHPWLDATVAAMVPAILLTPRFDGRGIVSRLALAELWQEHHAGRRDHALRLWALVMLECWFRACVDGKAAAEPLEYAALVRVA